MKIFVTGGAGFVGHHLVSSLLQEGHNVTIFDNLSNSSKNKISYLTDAGALFVKGDVTDYKSLLKKLAGFDLVIHLAAKINVEESITSPESTHFVNVTGTVNLLKACAVNKVPNIIGASSAAVYGNPKKMPLYESSSTIPISPYGATKLAIEHYLQAFSNCYSINSISLRFFNIYGQGQTFAYAGVIDKFMKRIVDNKSLIIYGDGKNTRDFVSIDDVIRSIILSMKKIDGKKGKVYNIAAGTSISIKELAKMMISLSGKRLEVVHKKPKKGDIRNSRASIRLARKELGYAPTVGLEEGLRKLLYISSNILPAFE